MRRRFRPRGPKVAGCTCEHAGPVTARSWLRRLLSPGAELCHGAAPSPGAAPDDPTGIWARSADTVRSVQRRLTELGRPPGEVGALLAAGREAGARVEDRVSRLCAAGSSRWPDPALQVPADAAGRALHDRVRALLALQRAVLHRATLLTMPAAGDEQQVLLAGLRRAVGELRAGLDADPEP